MINTERLLAEFQKLVSFDCESFHEAAIKDYLKEKLLALGLTVEEDDAAEKLGSGADGAGNLLGRLKGEEEGAPLLFCSAEGRSYPAAAPSSAPTTPRVSPPYWRPFP